MHFVINAFRLVWDVYHDFVEVSRKTVTGSFLTLRSGFVAVSTPRRDECGKVSVIWVEGNAVVPVPAVEHRLSFSVGFVFRLDRFQDAKFNVTVEACFYGLKWNRNRVVVCEWDGLWVNHESH